MDIPRKDMLPDPQPVVKEDVKPQEPAAPAPGSGQTPTVPPTAPGSHTPDSNLHAALAEERKLRKQAEVRAEEEAVLRKATERKLKELEPLPSEPSEIVEDQPLDDDSPVHEEVRQLKSKVSEMERRDQRRELEVKYPQLAEKRGEFDEFLEDGENSKLSLSQAAKLFLAEKGLLDTPKPARKGLEKPTGGTKAPTSAKISKEDIKRLRETQPRKYIKMLRDGVLNPDDIQG